MSTATQNTPAPYDSGDNNPTITTNSGATQSSSNVGTQPTRTDGPAAGTAGVHPSALGASKQPSTGGTAPPQQNSSSPENVNANADASAGGDGGVDGDTGGAGGNAGGNARADDGGYPEQRHAGHVDGVGPEYGKQNTTTMSDRITGLKEKVKGTVKRDPALKEQGHERMTGELKKKEKAKDSDPFANAKDEGNNDDKAGSGDGPQSAAQTESGTTDVPAAHPTDKGAAEQAASVDPAGSAPNETGQNAKQRAEAADIGDN